MHHEVNQQANANANANANSSVPPGARTVRCRVLVAAISFWVFYLFLNTLGAFPNKEPDGRDGLFRFLKGRGSVQKTADWCVPLFCTSAMFRRQRISGHAPTHHQPELCK